MVSQPCPGVHRHTSYNIITQIGANCINHETALEAIETEETTFQDVCVRTEEVEIKGAEETTHTDTGEPVSPGPSGKQPVRVEYMRCSAPTACLKCLA